MKDYGKISIIMPAYNAEKFIGSALDSIISQSYQNFEIIIIDDGSLDKTTKIAQDYIDKFTNITLLKQENAGSSAARNLGLKEAKGDYILFFDSDDLLRVNHLQILLGNLLKHRTDLIFCDTLRFIENDKSIDLLPFKLLEGAEKKYSAHEMFSILYKNNISTIHAMLFKKEVFDKIGYFDTNLKRLQDWDFWIRAAKAGFSFYYLKQNIALYRITPREHERQNEISILIREYEREIFIKHYSSQHVSTKEFNLRYANWYKFFIKELIALGHNNKAKIMLKEYFKKFGTKSFRDYIRCIKLYIKLIAR